MYAKPMWTVWKVGEGATCVDACQNDIDCPEPANVPKMAAVSKVCVLKMTTATIIEFAMVGRVLPAVPKTPVPIIRFV